jgi:hypothetical protein
MSILTFFIYRNIYYAKSQENIQNVYIVLIMLCVSNIFFHIIYPYKNISL